MKIAYCPISSNLESSDYRRFVGYCSSNNVQFDVLNNKDLEKLKDGQYNYVVVTVASDLTYWAKAYLIKLKLYLIVLILIFF